MTIKDMIDFLKSEHNSYPTMHGRIKHQKIMAALRRLERLERANRKMKGKKK